MTRFAISMNDGSVAVMQMIAESTPEAEIARWPEAERARVVSVTPIKDADIPADRTFRNAWQLNGKRIDHDMDKARGAHMRRIRRRRNAHLNRLDTETTIALGKGDAATVAEVEGRKQTLRDLPTQYAEAISAAQDIESLKAIWPGELSR